MRSASASSCRPSRSRRPSSWARPRSWARGCRSATCACARCTRRRSGSGRSAARRRRTRPLTSDRALPRPRSVACTRVVHLAASWVLAAVLAAAAVTKLSAPERSRRALAGLGMPAGAWLAVPAAELALAAGVAAGLDAAAYAAAGLMAAFAAVLARALRRGRAGAPCACFGARSTVSRFALGRAVVLAAAFAALPALPRGHVSTQTWLALGLGVAVAAIVALGVAVLALAREVGLLKLAVGAQGALEVPDEGPPLGERTALVERFAPTGETRLAVA